MIFLPQDLKHRAFEHNGALVNMYICKLQRGMLRSCYMKASLQFEPAEDHKLYPRPQQLRVAPYLLFPIISFTATLRAVQTAHIPQRITAVTSFFPSI